MNLGQLRYGAIDDKARGSDGDHGIAIAATALSFATAVAYLHPHPLVLPLLSILLVVSALGLAGIVALRTRSRPGPLVERLHLAGIIMFFGFAAAIMGDPDPAVKSLEAMR